MKTESTKLRIIVNHNHFIRTVIQKIVSQFALTLFWGLLLAVGVVLIINSNPNPISAGFVLGCFLFFSGGVVGLFQVVSIFRDVKEINTIHKNVTERENELMYKTLQSEKRNNKKEGSNRQKSDKNGQIY